MTRTAPSATTVTHPGPVPALPNVPLAVTIVDDAPLIMMGLGSMLEPYTDRVRVVLPPSEFGAATPVDVTLYDISEPHAAGHSVEDLLGDPVHGKVIAYSWGVPTTLLEEALARGCAGYVDKRAPAADLVDAIERVAAGARDVQQHGRDQHHEPASPSAWPGREWGLSRREAEVISLITQGLTNEDITEQTYLSINTVKSYIRSAYQKLDITRRSQAVRWGLEHGMLRPSGPAACHLQRSA